jgi:hypothetical protein
LPPWVLITGTKLAMCPRHQTAWSSPSGTGSERTARIRLFGQPHKWTSCHRSRQRMSSSTGKQVAWSTISLSPILHGGLKQKKNTEACDALLHFFSDGVNRYWSHVVQCRSCSAALKAMKALGVILQVASVAVIGFLALANGTLATSVVHRAVIVSAAVLGLRHPFGSPVSSRRTSILRIMSMLSSDTIR